MTISPLLNAAGVAFSRTGTARVEKQLCETARLRVVLCDRERGSAAALAHQAEQQRAAIRRYQRPRSQRRLSLPRLACLRRWPGLPR
jgi:hypothetical protein